MQQIYLNYDEMYGPQVSIFAKRTRKSEQAVRSFLLDFKWYTRSLRLATARKEQLQEAIKFSYRPWGKKTDEIIIIMQECGMLSQTGESEYEIIGNQVQIDHMNRKTEKAKHSANLRWSTYEYSNGEPKVNCIDPDENDGTMQRFMQNPSKIETKSFSKGPINKEMLMLRELNKTNTNTTRTSYVVSSGMNVSLLPTLTVQDMDLRAHNPKVVGSNPAPAIQNHDSNKESVVECNEIHAIKDCLDFYCEQYKKHTGNIPSLPKNVEEKISGWLKSRGKANVLLCIENYFKHDNPYYRQVAQYRIGLMLSHFESILNWKPKAQSTPKTPKPDQALAKINQMYSAGRISPEEGVFHVSEILRSLDGKNRMAELSQAA